MRLRLLLPVLTLAITAAGQSRRASSLAQDAGVSGVTPSLGFVAAEGTAELRPVLGLKAFAGVGSPLSLPNAGTRAVLSPDQRYALVQSTEGNWSVVLLESGISAGRQLEATGETPVPRDQSFRWCSRFLPKRHPEVEVIAGLPAAAEPVFTANVPAGATLVSLAVDDSADLVLAGLSYGDVASIVALRANDAVSTVGQVGFPSAIVFEKNSRRAMVADRSLHQVLSVEAGRDGQNVQVLAGPDLQVAAPSGLAIDQESRKVLVVNSGARSIVVLSLAGKPAWCWSARSSLRALLRCVRSKPTSCGPRTGARPG